MRYYVFHCSSCWRFGIYMDASKLFIHLHIYDIWFRVPFWACSCVPELAQGLCCWFCDLYWCVNVSIRLLAFAIGDFVRDVWLNAPKCSYSTFTAVVADVYVVNATLRLVHVLDSVLTGHQNPNRWSSRSHTCAQYVRYWLCEFIATQLRYPTLARPFSTTGGMRVCVRVSLLVMRLHTVAVADVRCLLQHNKVGPPLLKLRWLLNTCIASHTHIFNTCVNLRSCCSH